MTLDLTEDEKARTRGPSDARSKTINTRCHRDFTLGRPYAKLHNPRGLLLEPYPARPCRSPPGPGRPYRAAIRSIWSRPRVHVSQLASASNGGVSGVDPL